LVKKTKGKKRMNNEPIIIGGCGSSGTTLLRKMLNAHPNIACGPEMSVFDRPKLYEESLDYLYTLYRALDLDPLDDGMLFPLRMQPTNFTYCGLHPDNHSRFYHEPAVVEKMFDEAETIAEFLDRFFYLYAAKQNKKRWAEKTPNNLFCIDQIFDWYPNAHFIVAMRDGRDVVLSLTARRQTHSIVAIFRWLISAAAFLDVLDREPDYIDRIIRVNYEDLVSKPAAALGKICSRIGEPYDSAMLDYWKNRLPEDPEPGPNDEKVTGGYGTQPVFTDSVGKWKKDDINPALETMMKLTMRQTLLTLGYEDWKTTDQN
jgi:hypothetical protein